MPLPVFAAIANPDTAPTIWDVHVNQNVISQGDIVFTGLYNIPYATPPTATADQTFIIRLMDPTGTTDLGSVAPFNYNGYHNGYNQGAFSFISRLVIHYHGEQLTSFKLLKTHHNLLLSFKMEYQSNCWHVYQCDRSN